MAAMPAPMAATPAPVATPTPVAPMPVPVMTPVHLFGLEAVHLALRGNCGTGILVRRRPSVYRKRMRRQRRGLSTRGQGGSARSKSNGEFQKIAAFHDNSLFMHGA